MSSCIVFCLLLFGFEKTDKGEKMAFSAEKASFSFHPLFSTRKDKGKDDGRIRIFMSFSRTNDDILSNTFSGGQCCYRRSGPSG